MGSFLLILLNANRKKRKKNFKKHLKEPEHVTALEWKEGGTCFPGEALNLTKYRVVGVNFSCVQLQYRPQLEGILYAGGCCGSLAAYLNGAL